MARKSISAKPKAKKTTSMPRRGTNAARIVEEKKVGYETVDWASVENFEDAFRDTLRNYGHFYGIKDGNKWAIEWVKKNYDKKSLAAFKVAEPWKTSMTVCSMCKMMLNGAEFDEKRMTWLRKSIQETIDYGKKKIAAKSEEVTTVSYRKSPAEIVKERTSDFIAEIEQIIDDWHKGVWLDIENYSVYNELQKIEAAYNTAKFVVDYYTPQMEEIQELVTKKTDDLVEAYGHIKIRKRKELLKLLTIIISDAEKYMSAKKVVRKPRKKKVVSTTQSVSKVTYLKDSAEYKIVSVDPTEIVGASVVWLFNVKYRTITKLVSSSSSGLTVKGTTIYDFDSDLSTKKKLRKPEDFISVTTKTTKTKINKEYDTIKTKPSAANGRVNSDTIIYKVYK